MISWVSGEGRGTYCCQENFYAPSRGRHQQRQVDEGRLKVGTAHFLIASQLFGLGTLGEPHHLLQEKVQSPHDNGKRRETVVLGGEIHIAAALVEAVGRDGNDPDEGEARRRFLCGAISSESAQKQLSGYTPFNILSSPTMRSVGGLGSARNPPGGMGKTCSKRDSCEAPSLCLPATICCNACSADSMSGLGTRNEVRPTALCRNSLAKTVWAAMDESPSKVSRSFSTTWSSLWMLAAGVAVVLTVEWREDVVVRDAVLVGRGLSLYSVAEAETEGVRLLVMVRVSSRSIDSMPARRASNWSILRSLDHDVRKRERYGVE